MALYREDLDAVGCGSPGCDHKDHQDGAIFLHAACHMGAGVEAEYKNGEVTIRCNECKGHVTTIAVANKSMLN